LQRGSQDSRRQNLPQEDTGAVLGTRRAASALEAEGVLFSVPMKKESGYNEISREAAPE